MTESGGSKLVFIVHARGMVGALSSIVDSAAKGDDVHDIRRGNQRSERQGSSERVVADGVLPSNRIGTLSLRRRPSHSLSHNSAR